MSKTEQEVRDIILEGFSQHTFLESIDTLLLDTTGADDSKVLELVS